MLATQKIAAIYARVSTTDQADRGYSLPTQIEAYLAWADREGYVVPESYRYVDDFTGTSLNRPELKKLREALSARLVQAVIVYDLDRLARKLAHQLLLTEECENMGLPYVSFPCQRATRPQNPNSWPMYEGSSRNMSAARFLNVPCAGCEDVRRQASFRAAMSH